MTSSPFAEPYKARKSLRLRTRDCGSVHSQSCGAGPYACPGLRGPVHPLHLASHLRLAPAGHLNLLGAGGEERGRERGTEPTGESSKAHTTRSFFLYLSLSFSVSKRQQARWVYDLSFGLSDEISCIPYVRVKIGEGSVSYANFNRDRSWSCLVVPEGACI